MASAGFAPPLAIARPQRRGGLDPARRDAYVALVTAVGTLPGAPVDGDRSAWAADRLAAEYAARLPESRQAIDGMLDMLARRGFARMSDGDRVALLRDWDRSGRDGRDLAAHATALAALPFTPEAESEDDVIKPVPVAL